MKNISFKKITIALLSISTLVSFQNCGQQYAVQISDGSTEKMVCKDGVCHERFLVKVKAGLQELPPLKMFFIVDNSYTMKANQVNLSSSFAKMFSSDNTSDLTPFDLTAYLFNTSQRNLDYNLVSNSPLNLLSQNLLSLNAIDHLSMSDINGVHRPYQQKITGKIPGDLIGYSITKSENGKNFTFLPAPVLGFSNLENKSLPLQGMHKKQGEDAEGLKNDFQQRLELLDPDRNPANYEFTSILDNESGLCSMARILRDNKGLVKPGELSTFVIVSDENESDPEGNHCLSEQRTTSAADDLIDGSCITKRTDFSYSISGSTAASCRANYKTGYLATYSYKNPNFLQTEITYSTKTTKYTVPRSRVSYRKISSTTYSAPSSLITYDTIASQSYLKTQLTYYTKSCPLRDNIIDLKNCIYTPHTSTHLGNQIGNCLNKALELDSKALQTGEYAPSCKSLGYLAVSSCTVSDPLCKTTLSSTKSYVQVFGSYSSSLSQTACTDRASSITGAFMDNTHLPQCSPTTPKTGSGNCPSGSSSDCSISYTYSIAESDINGSFDHLTNQAACDTVANSLPSPAVDAANHASCTALTATTGASSCPSGVTCVATDTPATALITVDGDFTTSEATCDTKASSYPGSIIKANSHAICVKKTLTKSYSGDYTVNFNSSIDPGVVAAGNSNCSESVKQKIKSGISNLPAGLSEETCTIKSILGTSEAIALSESANCANLSASVCSSSSDTKRSCTESYTAGSTTSTSNKISASESLTCDSLCSQSITGFCRSKPGLTISTNTDIKKYLEGAYGATSCSTSIVQTGSTNFTAQLYNQRDQICKPSNGTPKYLSNMSQIYHADLQIQEPVTGSSNVGLVNYISSRSNELFSSGLNPIVSVFIRRSADPVAGILADPIESETGGSLGTHYEALADAMSGKKFSVKIDDYSPALVELSDIVKSKLGRSFVISEMMAPQKIRSIMHRRVGEDSWNQLTDDQWSVSGNTVTLPTYEFNAGDDFQFEYY